MMDDTQVSTRLTSGVDGLDTLLKGGFIKGGVYLLLGPPGSGKTILGNQICFHHAQAHAGSIVYVTLLAESHSRMMSNLRSLDYFDDDLIARSIHYMSGYHALEKDGLRGLLLQIAGMIRDKKATLLMIDGMTTIGDMDQSTLAFRKFAHELNTFIATSGCTAFLLSSMAGQESNPEHTMVDGIVALHHQNLGLRSSRQIEVRKFRGSDHYQGKHFFAISKHGIKVYPRLESIHPEDRSAPHVRTNRLTFGIQGFDEMLGGGVIRNSVTTVIGAAGTGKTILGLHFLQAGAAQGERGLLFGFYERPEDLIEKASSLGLDLKQSVEDGKIELHWHPALEQELDILGDSLVQAVIRTRAQRVFIDGVDGFRYSTSYKKRLARFFVAIMMKLKSLGVTVLIVEETSLFRAVTHRQIAELSALNENLIFLRTIDVGPKMMRVVSILKVRNAIYDSTVREFHIDATGIEVRGPVKSSEGIITAQPRGL